MKNYKIELIGKSPMKKEWICNKVDVCDQVFSCVHGKFHERNELSCVLQWCFDKEAKCIKTEFLTEE